MAGFEQKPKTFSIFEMSDEDKKKKKDFYYDNDWNEDNAPTWSGKLVLEDGTTVRLEGRFINGKNGEFMVGSCYIPKSDSGGGDRGRSDRGGGDRGGDRSRDRGGADRTRDDRGASRGGGDRGQSSRSGGGGSRGGWDTDDDVPF